MSHVSVMLYDVVSALKPVDGEVYVDGTFGAGGYSTAFLNKADCTVIAIDRDPSAISKAQEMKSEYGARFVFIEGCFGDALELVKAAGYDKVDGFVLDIGVSSMQIDQAERGFSFQKNGPLDMRMTPVEGSMTASDIVMTYGEEELANIIYQYGDERKSRHIAKRIVMARAEEEIDTTEKLTAVIHSVIPRLAKDKTDPATKTFQALRIAVNDELGELHRGLDAATELLNEGGRLVVVSFHSLEDGIVKSFMYDKAGMHSNPSRYMPSQEVKTTKLYTLPKRKAYKPSEEEVAGNVRSRSARMRVAIRSGEQEKAEGSND